MNHLCPEPSPVGVFDSGVGGLSVLLALRRELPGVPLLYVADTRYAPYGDRDAAFVTDRVNRIARFLLDQGAQALVMACNTATVSSAGQLRSWSPVPVVGIEPAIKPAAAHTQSGVIGVLCTSRTAASPAVASLRERFGSGAQIVVQPCPGLADRVEHGSLDDPATGALLDHYLAEPLAAGADVIVLGCTHYAFLADAVRARVPAGTLVIEPSQAVARQTARCLPTQSTSAASNPIALVRFFSNGDLAHSSRLMSRLWGEPVVVQAFDA